ncbi:hypothetical protein BDB01DRAFT_851559 [Pilobolus umbonatus]|nr:hypothetical protein BDB01DRAFT_851559 [Pilobolus umbonatus]
MKWLPLPKIAHGTAIYPFNPSTLSPHNSRPLTTYSTGLLLPGFPDQSTPSDQPSSNPADYAHLIPLEVGDELFIIEQQGQWFRGYVLCLLEDGRKPNRAPIGCFPRTHVQIKEYFDIDSNEAETYIFSKHNKQGLSEERPVHPPRLLSELTHHIPRSFSDTSNHLSRSFSESFIQSPTHDDHIPRRPGSYSDLNLDTDTDMKHPTTLHISPPSLPLARFEQSTTTGNSEPLVDEIAACISEWYSLLHTYIEKRQYDTVKVVRDHINSLFQARRHLLDQALSREELVKLRREIVHLMIVGNMEQNQDIIIRHPDKGYLIDSTNSSISSIYQMHYKYAYNDIRTISSSMLTSPFISAKQENSAASTNEASNYVKLDKQADTSTTSLNSSFLPKLKGGTFYHIFFELKACVAHICQPGEFTELYFSLYSATEKKFITEKFVVVLNSNGMPKDESQIGKLQTLFVDLSGHDLSEEVYLVCHIIRLGGMKMTEGKDHFNNIVNSTSIFGSHYPMKTFQRQNSFNLPMSLPSFPSSPVPNGCRRPFGCAVLKLNSIVLQCDAMPTTAANPNTQANNSEYNMLIYTPASESNYTSLHEDIIFDNVKEIIKNPKADQLRIYIRSFYGYLDDVLKSNAALLHDVPQTLRLGFADVVFPNDNRNELYITLQSADFSHLGKARNIQVVLCVRDNQSGDIIENAICVGAGAKSVSYWESMLIYHEPKPRWNETIKITINDIEQWERSHIFFTVKHKSSSGSSVNSNPTKQINTHGEYIPSSGEKLVAMGFVPLFLPPLHRDFIADGTHTLYMYKFEKQYTHPRFYLESTPWCVRSTCLSVMPPNNIESTNQPKSKGARKGRGHHYSSSGQSFKSMNESLHSTATSVPNTALFSSSSSIGEAPSQKLNMLRDTVTISTFLCSTRFTQNKTLVKLFNWRSLLDDNNRSEGTGELLAVLDQFTFVGEIEVVKFLGDTLDALLDILVFQFDKENYINDDIHTQAIASIVWLLGIVQDRRFSNFRPVLDVYIKNRFSVHDADQEEDRKEHNYTYKPVDGAIYKHLLHGISRLCQNAADPAKAKLLRSSIKVWDYLFRFIVRSRLCQQQGESEEESSAEGAAFREDLQDVLDQIIQIMKPDQPSSMIGTQTLTLQHFADILVELHHIFSLEEVIDIATAFVDSCSHVTGRLVGFKLAMILNIVKGPTFTISSSGCAMIKTVFRWIRLWINAYMITAKDVIFARQVEQQSDVDHQQIRLPRAQWIENLRLSLSILVEIFDKVRRILKVPAPGTFSPSASSPSLSHKSTSRPTSYATTNGEECSESPNAGVHTVVECALELLPQMITTYADLQKLAIQAMKISNNTSQGINTEHSMPASPTRPLSRQSFSMLRERGNSLGSNGKNPLSNDSIIQESSFINIASAISNTNQNKSKFTVVLQALATSPATPFPSIYPYQPTPRTTTTSTSKGGLNNDHIAMITTGLLDLTVVILELFHLTPRHQWVLYMKNMYGRDGVGETSEFMCKVIHMCMGILFGYNLSTLENTTMTDNGMIHCEEDESNERRQLPKNWLNLVTIAHQIVLCNILVPMKDILELPDFIPSESNLEVHDYDDIIPYEEDEDEDDIRLTSRSLSHISLLLLWRTYFYGFLRVVGSPKLEVSNLMPQSQRTVWKIIGNMRGELGAKVILNLWKLAGRYCNPPETPASGYPRYKQENHKISELVTDYFGPDFLSSFKNNGSTPSTSASTNASSFLDHSFYTEEPLRQSMASIEEVEDDHAVDDQSTLFDLSPSYSVRHSVKIGPMDHLPLFPPLGKEDRHEKSNLDHYKLSLLQHDLSEYILSPLCAVSLTLHDRVRINTLSIIADIIASELYSLNGELGHVQHCLIGTLDRLVMSESKGDDIIQEKFTSELNNAIEYRLKQDGRSDLLEAGHRAVNSLGKFLDLILQIRSLPADDEFMDERITATLKLMKFIQVIEREEIYIKYVHQLVELHLDSKNFIEAALTLRFHADLLRWDPMDRLAEIPELNLPVQSSFSRKEGLYMKMIAYLDQGNAWELCIELCKELAFQFENTLYDYNKLSDILQRQALLAENIIKKERCFTEYFRVGFYGRGFPASNRNQQYIYRGLEWEKMPSFIERMQNRHPNAQILTGKMANSATIPEDQLKDLESSLDGQYLQITAVNPVPDNGTYSFLSNLIVPENIKKYYSFNEVSKFSFSRPVHKEVEDSDMKQSESEFLNLWTEKVDFVCEDKFPTIVRRSKIIAITKSEVSPIENAVIAMENKNRELMALEKKYSAYLNNGASNSTTHPVNISPFSMSLNGAVDAPVNGGVPLYKKAFLTKEYWMKNPDMREWIDRLQSAIHDQVMIVTTCLETHNKLVSSEMRPFHTTLTEFFHKNFAEEIRQLKERGIEDRNMKERTSIATYSSVTLSSSHRQSILTNDSQFDDKSILSRHNTLTLPAGNSPILPNLPTMSPISRAFSIKTPTAENANVQNIPTFLSNNTFESASMSRAESFSRTLKISLRKKSRKKSQSAGSVHSVNTISNKV